MRNDNNSLVSRLFQDRLECLRFGCDDYISKPINWEILFKTLSGYLEGSKAGSERL